MVNVSNRKDMVSIFLFLLVFIGLLDAQPSTNKDYGILENIHSESMEKELPVLVFLPQSYTELESPTAVVYLLHGYRSGEDLDSELTEAKLRSKYDVSLGIQEMADFYNLILVTPLVSNSFYLDSETNPTIKFSTYVGEELPHYIDSKYNTIKTRDGRYLAGFSMGGYGAVSLLCKYPDRFSVALNRAGILNLATGVEDLDWDEPVSNVGEILGNYWSYPQKWHQNSCFNLVNHIRHRDDIAIVIEVGVDDFLYKTNKKFKIRLDELGVPNIYSEYPGGHYWSKNALNSLLSQLEFFRIENKR